MQAVSRKKVAYDLSRFDRRTLVKDQVGKEKAEARTKAKSRVKARPAVSGFSVFCSVVVFVMLMALLFSHVNLSEASDMNRQKNIKLEKLREEIQMLEISQNQRVGALKVREYAVTRLGMSKLDKSQIRYVETPGGDRFEVAEQEKETSGVIAGLAKGFSRIIEFVN